MQLRGHLACGDRLRRPAPFWHRPRAATQRIVRLSANGSDALPGSVQQIMADLRADPTLGPVLDSPRLQRALQELREDPGRAMAKYSNDAQVMAVLARLTAIGLQDSSSNVLSQLGTNAPDVASSVFSDGQLAAWLSAPRVRAALAEIRANPEAAMAKYEADEEIMGVLDMLQRRMEAQGSVIDV